jgi:anti-anti-sigma factor
VRKGLKAIPLWREGRRKKPFMSKILVIDDEKTTLNMFRLFLTAYGHTVFLAEDGETGLETFLNEKPSIVFTDIKMPGIDGFEVLRRIKEMDPATEVIVVTGHGDMDLAVQALNLNATDFINKPIQRTALDSALGRAQQRLQSSQPQVNRIGSSQMEGVTVLRVEGDITSLSEQTLTDAYEQATGEGVRKILMHFDRNSSINGAGIAILIQLLSKSKKRGQLVAITGVPENFKKIFDLVGITRFAEVFDHAEEAVTALSRC